MMMAPGSGRSWLFIALCALTAFSYVGDVVQAQSTTPAQSASAPANSSSVTLITTNFTTTITTTSASRTVVLTSVIPTTLAVTATTAANATATNSTSTPSATPIALDTRIDPGFGVLGAILIITGLPSTFWGHKNRWSSFFLIGFYTFALACLSLILKFGVLEAINSPSETLRGVFVLACCIAGIAGGGVAIFFWQQAKYFIGGWGGFAIGLWVQCFRNGGLIRPIGFRWLMYIGLGVVGFCICTVPKYHYHVLLASTAAVGATAFILGIDCFTTANLKEFYIWNLGFNSLFTKYINAGIEFPVSQMMQIELGLIGAFTLMGAAVQLRILRILQFKLKEISRELKRRDEELEAQAAARFVDTSRDLAEWEKEHGRQDSRMSSLPLLKGSEAHSPGTEDTPTLVMGDRRSRHLSGVSDFMAAPPLEDEYGRPRDRRQSIGALPALDLGLELEKDIPKGFVADNPSTSTDPEKVLSKQELEDLKKKEELMAEIQSIRKSIEVLRSATPNSSVSGDARSRRQSFASRRTLSFGFAEALEGPSRPPRAQDPRARVQSMDRLSRVPENILAGSSISRPSSAPLQDEPDWNEYVRERKLFQPPAGVSAPIAPQPKRPPVSVPNSVSEALLRRQQREAAIEMGDLSNLERHGRSSSHASSDDQPLARLQHPPKSATVGVRPSITILPPRRPDPAAQPTRPPPQRVYTFEELNERHREKLRDLQAPLSRAEREQAELAAARSRWERSKEVEKQVMAKRDIEKAAAAKQAEKRRHSGDDKAEKSPGVKTQDDLGNSRSLSADKLAKIPGAMGSTSKRHSMMKVEDWRRYQQEVDASGATPSGSRRDSSVPFPAAVGREPGNRGSNERRRSSQVPR